MSDIQDKIIDKLLAFGLEKDEANIYTYLLLEPNKSVQQISRKLGIGRNIVYRLVQKLAAKNLVKYYNYQAGQRLRALPYKNIEQLLDKKEEELNILKNITPELFGNFAELISGGEEVRIKYYQGLEGLKEITLNSLEAKDELLIYEVAHMSTFLDYGFAEDVRRGFLKRRIKVREITNLKEMPDWTSVKKFVLECWSCRYIDPDDLQIDFEFILYNDVYAMYTVKDEHIWGCEVESKPIAKMQKQIFNFLWQRGERMNIINNKGRVVLNDSTIIDN